jgi:hypothetical protein
MDLDQEQRKKVAQWIAQGLKLSEIQNHLASELGVRITYMDVRLLVDDLKLTPKDVEPPKPPQSALTSGGTGPAPGTRPATGTQAASATRKASGPAQAAKVSVAVDELARPGAAISGKVTFSDGNQADWYFDQAGRLGLAPQQAGYRPSATDLQQFQMLLEGELSRMGY